MNHHGGRTSVRQVQPQAGPDGSIHLAEALEWLEAGFSPLPAREDGSKAPIADILIGDQWTWSPYQTTPATREHVEQWYANGRQSNGVAGGPGGLDPFEFDDRGVYERFKELATEFGLGDVVARVEAGFLEDTPGGGVHWMWKCNRPGPPMKLAQRPDPSRPNGRRTLIETKGQGGFIIVAPSCGATHPTGKPYVRVQGGPRSIATITDDERDALLSLARSLDEMPAAEVKDPPKSQQKTRSDGRWPKQGISVGDAFNARATWDDIVEPHGWVEVKPGLWRRPGKDKGFSASTQKTKGFRVYTTSTSLDTKSYSKFGLYCQLRHNGDWTACVKDLAEQGYGTWKDEDGEEHPNPVPKDWKPKGKARDKKSGPDRAPSDYICSRSGEPIPCANNTKIWLSLQKPEGYVQYDRFRQAILLDGDPLSDQNVIDLAMEIEASMQTPWSQEHVRSALAHLAHQREFSSLVRWLESLQWDDTERIDKFFPDHYESEENEYSRECSRVFFLSAVARAFEPGCQADIMPVLIGPQGVGKSTGMAALCPNSDWFSDDLGSDLFVGKAAEGLQGKWIFEFGEFARINRATLDIVKSFISRRVDHYRPPYGRMAQDFPRTCIFVGTTDTDQPLHDIENRRFLPLKVLQANIPKIQSVRDQLWAEAVRRYKDGEKWYVTCPHLIAEIRSHLESARSEDAWEIILREKLEGRDQTTLVEAAQLLGLWDDRGTVVVNKLGKSEQTRIGTALVAIGFRRERGKRPLRTYFYERVVVPTSPEVGT
jgi:putative DNA primase/helicase